MNLQVGQEVTYANGEKGVVISVTAKSPMSIISQTTEGRIYRHGFDGVNEYSPSTNIIPPFKEGDSVWVSNRGESWIATIYLKQEGGIHVDVDGDKWNHCKKYVVGEKP